MSEQKELNNAVSMTATGESAPTDEQQIVASIRAEMHARDLADAAARSDAALRTAMTKLIPQIGLLVKQAAVELAAIKSIDKTAAADDLTWQIAEYLSGHYLERDGGESEAQICKAEELDAAHAAEWFSINDTEAAVAKWQHNDELPLVTSPSDHDSIEIIEELRQDHAIRLEMPLLVVRLAKNIKRSAIDLADSWMLPGWEIGKFSQDYIDRTQAILLWQFAEYILGTKLPRNSVKSSISLNGACEHFRVAHAPKIEMFIDDSLS